MTGRRAAGWLTTLSLGLAALVLAGCSSSPSSHSSATTTTSTSTSASTTTSSTTASASSTSTTGAGGPAQNLTATAAVKSSLTAAYVAHSGLPADEVQGTAPGSVYYAYLPSTQTYWAIASFVPSSTASQQTQVAMQDDGCCGIFTMTSGGSWTFQSGFLGTPCAGQVPAEIFSLWGLQSPGDCADSTTTTAA